MNSNRIKIIGLDVQDSRISHDVDKDGVIDASQKKRIVEPPIQRRNNSSVAEIIDKLNRDAKDPYSNFTSIDFNTDLTDLQCNAYGWHDSLVEFRCSPKSSLSLTRGLMRKLVSLKRGGRREAAAMQGADKTEVQKPGFGQRVRNAMNRDSKNEPQQINTQ